MHERQQWKIAAPKIYANYKHACFPELSIQVIPSFADLQVQEIIQRQSQLCNTATEGARRKPRLEPGCVEELYERCGNICEEYGKTYYLAWGRRIGDIVDGPGSVCMSSDGMRMDTRKFRYWNFQELYFYSYYAGGTFGLMSVPIIGIAPDSLIPVQSVYEGAIHFGTANQLTNILRDVGEDATLDRVYLPQDELAHFGLSNNDIFARKIWSAYVIAISWHLGSMESIPLRHAVSATNQSFLLRRQSNPENQFQTKDSKGYAKPSRVLTSTEVKICTDNSVEKYRTSNVYGSSLSDLNAGILLCVIDENVLSVVTDHATDSKDGVLHFQRRSVDPFTFEGTKLGKIEADYNFEAEDTLLGEGSDSSMVQLRPCHQAIRVDPVTIFTKSLPESTLPVSGISNGETMREYEDLKLSLLLYDAMLIFVGTSVASFSAAENISFAFLTGGMGGFFYLLLLQRSVDGLPAAELTSTNTGQTNQTFGGSKVPIFVLALAIGFTLLTVKYGSGDVPIVFTPKELIAGMIGFLACKVSVVLAAVKP
ncbi:hypothetical protein D8674_007235 [Pyrus ussuriensis x Pyrus communis]|uniref:DUF7755 domain-containing protein n=1 Tax=Pyrus ussuriensis x Pyrus communis TaxID=2448454 RepID=A0A5N5FWK4_9ROSA|nr:hypothetical protein D8674_007235 [Pyrus ussuriensis x Pyrus communis]